MCNLKQTSVYCHFYLTQESLYKKLDEVIPILCFSFLRSDTTPLLNNSTQDRMFDTMSVEIEQLLAKVSKTKVTKGQEQCFLQ